jgi:hypothetical protein
MLRRVALAAVAGVAVAVPAGCRTQSRSESPIVRQDQLSERSEDLRQVDVPLHWGRGDQEKNDNLVTKRIHGSIQ